MGNSGLKREPITNDLVAVSGSITADFLDKAVFAERFLDNTQFALVWSFKGAVISGVYFDTFEIELPANFLTGPAPTLDGLDVVSGDFSFETFSNGTDPVATIRYITTDTTL